jgi:DNA-binding transcriptional LysR family regulator
MNPTHLLTFAIVARFQSITKAAEYLNLGQPAVSGQLKLLQTAVGEPLYERRKHKLELTPAGKGLLKYAENMQRDFKQAQDYIRCLRQVNTGSLRIGATMTMTSYFLPEYLVKLQTDYPGVQVYMETGDTREIIDKMHDYDLGFVEGPVAAEELPINFEVVRWKSDEIVLILPEQHPLASQYPLAAPLSVLAEYPVIWREPGSGARQAVEQALLRAGVSAPVAIEVMGVTAVMESVRAGLGIGFASAKALQHEGSGLVSRRLDPPAGVLWELNIIVPKEVIRSRVAKAFLDLIKF